MGHEMISIPGGEFKMGISEEKAQEVVLGYFSNAATVSPYMYYREAPVHAVSVKPFQISKFEVTNEEYQAFVNVGGYQERSFWQALIGAELNVDQMGWDRMTLLVDRTQKPGPSTWSNGTYAEGKARHPVEGISFYEAAAFCAWKKMRLPTEAEWEYTARGTDARMYAWGNDIKPISQRDKSQVGVSFPVGTFLQDKSPFGAMDLSCNVAEWVSDTWHLYPGAPLDTEEVEERFGIVRGGHHSALAIEMRSTHRLKQDRLERNTPFGFRCAGL